LLSKSLGLAPIMPKNFSQIGRFPMKLSLETRRSKKPGAWLGETHGYRFEGDEVFINAEIFCHETQLAGQQWALQLWSETGVMIADLPLGQLSPNGSGALYVSGCTNALPPAGQEALGLSLVLVSNSGEGADCVEDFAHYPQPVGFLQPRMTGTVCCSFAGDLINFDIACIENPRPSDNLSGTLALELWVLDAPYFGGDWMGVPVASLVLGTLSGQNSWLDWQVSSHAAPLPAGGHLILMLREWTPAGYVTRDYRALTRPSVEAVKKAPAAKPKARAAEKVPAVKAPAVKEPAVNAAPVIKAKAVEDGMLSVNSASKEALAAVKGLSAAMAAAIVDARPYKTLDELVRAKGIGPKLLEKLRQALKV
jgi:DNA uptake protein ComE-like DNA-binding protein